MTKSTFERKRSADTNADIARRWGVTRERVRQIERSALRKLREGLIAAAGTDKDFAQWLRDNTQHTENEE